MANKPTDQRDNQPSEYDKLGKSIRKDDPNIGKIVTSLRADMLPATEEQPARKSIFQQENLKIAVGIWLALVILALIWYVLLGPGRPEMERNLARLAHRQATSSPTYTASPSPPTNTPIPPSNTPTVTPTLRPSNTPLIGLNSLATATIESTTPTPSTDCRQAISITLNDVGQEMCVQGVVIETVTNPTDFMVIFSNEKGAFYWVSYDLVWSQAELDTCYQVEGKIDRIGNSPVLVFGYQNLPEECP